MICFWLFRKTKCLMLMLSWHVKYRHFSCEKNLPSAKKMQFTIWFWYQSNLDFTFTSHFQLESIVHVTCDLDIQYILWLTAQLLYCLPRLYHCLTLSNFMSVNVLNTLPRCVRVHEKSSSFLYCLSILPAQIDPIFTQCLHHTFISWLALLLHLVSIMVEGVKHVVLCGWWC